MSEFARLLLYASGLLGQALLLRRIAGLEGADGALVVAGFSAAAMTLPAFSRRLAPCHQMGIGMLALGGFGMTLGWWLDLGAPAAAAGLVEACHAAPGAPHLHLLSWMNAGMLLLGLPAMTLALPPERRGAWRTWRRGGLLALGAPAMVVGMLAGSLAASLLASALGLPAEAARLADWAAMNVGMLAAMPPAHTLADYLSRRAGVPIRAAHATPWEPPGGAAPAGARRPSAAATRR